MQNQEIPKLIIWTAYYEFYEVLDKATEPYKFRIKPNSSDFQLLDKENAYNKNFCTLLATVHHKLEYSDYQKVFINIRDLFGFDMPITFILKHVWQNETLTLSFSKAFFIGKDSELYVFTDIESMVVKINQIVNS